MKDKDFITSKFESEGITAPESLSEANIKAKLDSGTSVKGMVSIKKNNKRHLQRFAALAACVAVALGTVFSVNAIHDSRVEKAIQKNIDNGVVHFADYDELKTFTGKLENQYGFRKYGLVEKGLDTFSFSKSNSAMEAESAADNASSVGSGTSAHSETYKQVEDVDEADIVKTDGEYIYFLDSSDSTLVIYSADNGKTALSSKLFHNDGEIDYTEMYLNGDRLYIVGNDYGEDESTVVKTVDISDRKNAKELGTYKQSGTYSSSRMIDDCIYVISNKFVYDGKYIPRYTNVDGNYAKIPADDICAFQCCRSIDYAVIGALDTGSGKNTKTKAKAVLGGAENIYCTTENLYVACTNYEKDYERTNIIKYELNGINIKEKTVGSVKGYTNNQWSFDEKDGYLRVATTTTNSSGNQVNKLYILDKNLETISDVGGFAKDEHIEAVKYIGDMAYVITYETTDPLFCIDLSDPKAPQITGKVKISGFSTNLVPVGEDKLMGIGYYTRTNKEWGGIERAGVKIALFDISDKNAPKVLDEKVYVDAYSDAQNTHKAILKNGDTLAIPITFTTYDEDEYVYEEENSAAIVFTEKDGKIEIIKEHKSDNQVDRVVYIGDYYYTVDTFGGTVSSFK